MKITVHTQSVLLEVNSEELATLNCALGSFLALAANPRPGKIGDRIPDGDAERANAMEQDIFHAWCKLDDNLNASVREVASYVGVGCYEHSLES